MTGRMKVEELDPEGSPDGHTPQVQGNRLVLAAPPAGGGGSSLTIQDENGNVATDVTQIDFQGAGVTATGGTGEVVVTIPGDGGGGSSVAATRDICTATTIINSTAQTDITGLSRSVTVGSTTEVYIVHVTLDVESQSSSSTYLVAKLNVAGTDQTSEMVYRQTSSGQRAANAQTWLVTGLAPGARTFKVRAGNTGGGSYSVNANHSSMTILKL